MRIKITHRSHWAWIIPAPGDVIGADEPTMPVDDGAPHVVRVKRLQVAESHTILEIPEDSASRMSQDRASVEMLPADRDGGVTPTVTRRHLHAVVTQHVNDIIHKHHSPIDHWTDIEVEDDPVLTRHLRGAFLESERGVMEAGA
jgi:hypothetical protein